MQPKENTAGTRKRVFLVLRLLVTLGLVALLLAVVDLGGVAEALRGVRPGFFLLGLAVVFGDRLLMAGKWYPLLRSQAPSIGFGRALRAYLATGFASYLLPATVGADVLRAVALGRGRRLVVEVGASIAVERLLGMLASAVFTLVALITAIRAEIRMEFLLPWALLSLGISLTLSMLPFSRALARLGLGLADRMGLRRLRSLVERFVRAIEPYRSDRGILATFTILSILEQLFPVAGLWFFARALGINVSLEMLIVSVPLVVFLSRLPVAFNGIGAVEGGYVYLLGLFGVGAEQALALAVTGRIGEILGVLPGALFWSDLAGRRDLSAEGSLGTGTEAGD